MYVEMFQGMGNLLHVIIRTKNTVREINTLSENC